MQFISLLELNLHLKGILNSQLEPSYWVVAEISELRMAQRGHCYLELVEKEGDILQAKLRATIWSSAFRNINAWFTSVTGEKLRQGMKILANITIEYHEIYGLSANIKDIDPKFTLGERAKRRQEIIDRLVIEGIFEMNQKIEMPLVTQRIAVISSPTAAGYGDFMHQLRDNEYSYKFLVDLFPAIMQGSESADSIIKALYKINEKIDNYDVVAIIRGGGAQVDMDCFDDYDLASHVAQFPLPVLTGIGHERDESVTDLVANKKLKTPTAVSAFLVSNLAGFEQKMEAMIRKASIITRNYCTEQKYKLEKITNVIFQYKSRYWESQAVSLSQLKMKIDFFSRKNLSSQRENVIHMERQLKSLTRNLLKEKYKDLDYLNNTVKLSDPELILKKGYTISYIQNKLLKDTEIEVNQVMITKSSQVTLESYITKTSKKENGK